MPSEVHRLSAKRDALVQRSVPGLSTQLSNGYGLEVLKRHFEQVNSSWQQLCDLKKQLLEIAAGQWSRHSILMVTQRFSCAGCTAQAVHNKNDIVAEHNSNRRKGMKETK